MASYELLPKLKTKDSQSRFSTNSKETSIREEDLLKAITSTAVSKYAPLVAIIAQLVVVIVLLVANFSTIYLRRPGVLSTEDSFLYITGITILASLVTSFTIGQTRKLWVLRALSRPKLSEAQRRRIISAAIGLASIKDEVLSWSILTSYITMGLGTAAIVANLSPSSASVILPLPSAWLSLNMTNCLVTSETPNPGNLYSWQLSNGSYLNVNQTDYDSNLGQTRGFNCPIQLVQPAFLDTFNTPGNYSYNSAGVAIGRSALGTPFFSGPDGNEEVPNFVGFGAVFGLNEATSDTSKAPVLWGTTPQFEWATQCLPVVGLNPVQCRPAGNVTVNQNNTLTVTSGNCTVTSPKLLANTTSEGASVSGYCTEGLPLGQAELVLGSVNSHAFHLAELVNEGDFNGSQTRYSASCSINVAPSLTFRTVNYSTEDTLTNYLQDSRENANLYHFITATSTDVCNPLPSGQAAPVLATDGALGTGALAAWQLITENQYTDGWWPSLTIGAYGTSRYNVTWLSSDSISETQVWNFDNSHNLLEDTLGLASAVAMSAYWGLNQELFQFITEGQMSILGVRVGPGKPWAVVYILPSLASIGYIAFLLRHTHKSWTIR